MEDYVEDANGFSGEEEELSVSRDGPVYIETLSGPLTSVGLFQSSILQELQVSFVLCDVRRVRAKLSHDFNVFQGRFKYQPNQVRAFGMLAGGTGVTPMFQVRYQLL
ncbi:hypothetical protein ABKV19_020462 [Rosa sericea]